MVKDVSSKKTRAKVLQGTCPTTVGGLKRESLKKNKYGKIVSKKKSISASKNPWIKAVSLARKELGIVGFVPIKKGTPLYKLAKEIYLN